MDALLWDYLSRDGWRNALILARREIILDGHQGPKRNLIHVIIAAERVLVQSALRCGEVTSLAHTHSP